MSSFGGAETAKVVWNLLHKLFEIKLEKFQDTPLIENYYTSADVSLELLLGHIGELVDSH